MDIFISAIVGDLISRSASFMLNKYYQQPDTEKNLQSLHRVLLRINTIVEEAEGRDITNRGMSHQLKMLRESMYRGYFVFDAFRYQVLHEEQVSDSSSALFKLSPPKRRRFSGSGSDRETLLFSGRSSIQELQKIVGTLEDTVVGMKEFLVFLGSYPRIFRQPYSNYLQLDNCMFGRQTEKEQVLNFLLRTGDTTSTGNLCVLPIVGPVRVGKSTLVEHVCKNARVRSHFSMILFFPENSLKDGGVINLSENMNCVVKHQNCASQKRLLVIVEIAEDIDKEIWSSLKSSTASMAPRGNKIIITSRSNEIVNLGTVGALRLDYLPPEDYWHFFKTIAFGRSNPDDQPKLAPMAMEIGLELRQCFTSAHVLGGLLRDNFSAQFWDTVLKCFRAYKQKNLDLFDENPNLLLRKDAPVYHWRLKKSSRYFMMCSYHQSDSTHQVPKLTLRDILLGCDTPHGAFEVLAWKACIPPYYNYTLRCMTQTPRRMVGRKKYTP